MPRFWLSKARAGAQTATFFGGDTEIFGERLYLGNIGFLLSKSALYYYYYYYK